MQVASYGCLRLASIHPPANLSHQVTVLRGRVRGAITRTTLTTISHVLLLRTLIEVRRVDAWRIVAVMQTIGPWPSSMRNVETHPVGADRMRVQCRRRQLAIAVLVEAASPQPAVARATLLNPLPEQPNRLLPRRRAGTVPLATQRESCDIKAARQLEEDRTPQPRVRSMSDPQMTIMTRCPANGNQVRGVVCTTLRTEQNVMQRRRFDMAPADPATPAVAVEHILANARWHQAQGFKLGLGRHPPHRRRRRRPFTRIGAA